MSEKVYQHHPGHQFLHPENGRVPPDLPSLSSDSWAGERSRRDGGGQLRGGQKVRCPTRPRMRALGDQVLGVPYAEGRSRAGWALVGFGENGSMRSDGFCSSPAVTDHNTRRLLYESLVRDPSYPLNALKGG